jgi:hypothetical protein
LYLVQDSDFTNAYNLVDSIIPDDEKKRVKIEDLKFYISGSGSTSKKVTITLTLALMPRMGISPTIAAKTRLHIQTTISERGWRKK